MTLFEQVKECVTARQAAEHYGIKVKRNGMACCPFHKDRHPSMKADKIYHCFACGVGGDAIDFTARLFGISQYEAAKKLVEDFGLDIKVGNRSKYERTPRNRAPLKQKQSKVVMIREKLEQWLKHATDVLIRYLKWIQFWKEFYKPEPDEEDDIIMPGGPPVIQQILKGKEESRLTRQKLEIAVEHLLSVLRRLERLDRHDTI